MNDLTQLGAYLAHYPALGVVMTTTLLFAVGLFAQILANRTSLPGIIFLLLFGSVLGQYGFNLINPDVYGSNGLRAIIAVAVAIVVFEGGLLIDINQFRQNWLSVLGLITGNVFITIVGMAWVTNLITGIDWKISLMYAGLISVTGPTVISPILRRLHLRQKVKSLLETEAVLVDAVGVIAAVSIFNYVVATETASVPPSAMAILRDILLSLTLGLISGGACAFIAQQIVRRFAPLSGELTRMLVLATALSAYVIGELLSHESGIAAVALAGIIIGNTDFPHKNSIKAFKGDLTLISITVVFLLLSASIDLDFLSRIGVRGAVCVLILMVVIRPLGVFLSTFFESISWRERIFIASLGPRGIVAASAATFFAIELDAFGLPGSNAIRGLVFMTILMTVVIQGIGARYMAKMLGITPDSVLIIGAGTIGKKLIYQLKAARQEGIIVMERDPLRVEKLQPLSQEGVFLIQADARDEKLYRQFGQLEHISAVIATTDDDWVNLRVCQIVKRIKPEIQMISVINDVKGREVFENLGIQTINLPEAAATVIYVMMGQGSQKVLPPQTPEMLGETRS
ncbi:MAG: cation:proton antiporter [Candidatus Sericytochromatia bacterium]